MSQLVATSCAGMVSSLAMDATFPVGPCAVVSSRLLQALQRQYPLGAIEAWADLGGA